MPSAIRRADAASVLMPNAMGVVAAVSATDLGQPILAAASASGVTADPAAVPEAATWALLGAGAIGLGAYRLLSRA